MDHSSQSRKYAAFISYRHKFPDQQIARILHFLLEHNVIRPDRSLPRRIRPVFLDTSELPTQEDLQEGIREALDHSDSLFVICSPNLPLSKYCLEEIRYFKARHGGSINRIHTLLVAGEPEESFPDHLRTTVRQVTDPDGSVRMETVDAEPLFADIRGKSFLHSLRKLLKTEYLRLLAAYYRCPFDRLYKRQRRWWISVISCILLAVAAGIFGLSTYTSHMVSNSVAGKVEEVLQTGDTLSALTLSTQVERGGTGRYETALRSAVVQYDYQKNALPIAAALLNTYPDAGSTSRYISRDGSQILIRNSTPNGRNAILQITDAATGQIHLQEATDRIFVVGDNPDRYLILRSHEDETGTMMDYVSLMSLVDNSLISEFPFRESSRASANYRLVQAIENKDYLTVQDGEEFIAFLTSDGTPLTKEEFVQAALEYVDRPLEEEAAPYRLVRKRQQYLLKDETEQVLLELDLNRVSGYDFTADWKYFAWVEDEKIHVYDLNARAVVASSRCPYSGSIKLALLEKSTYYAVTTMSEGTVVTYIRDWNSGKWLLTLEGAPMFSPAECAFFTTEQGQLIRYDYNALDISAEASVTAHTQTRLLTLGEGLVQLHNTEDGTLPLQLSLPHADMTAADSALEHILVRLPEGLACYSGTGQQLWAVPVQSDCFALSPEGTVALWQAADGSLCLADADTGAEIRRIPAADLTETGAISRLAVCGDGVCVFAEEHTLFFPADGSGSFRTEVYSHGTATPDGLLILSDEAARVRDFVILDARTGDTLYRPESNTEKWVYSPVSGYLVRHPEKSGNNAALCLEVMKRTKQGFEPVIELPLTDNSLQHLTLDTSGTWLSITCGGRTQVYNLKNGKLWLDCAGDMFYEAGELYGCTVFGSAVYRFQPGDDEALRAYVRQVLTSDWSVRTLTDSEKKHFSIQ